MARPKKNTLPQKEQLAPGIERIEVGKGITRRYSYCIDLFGSDRSDWSKHLPGYSDVGLTNDPMPEDAIPIFFDEEEEEAKNILVNADISRAVNYRERIDPEWYAAEILKYITVIRCEFEGGSKSMAVRFAFHLGNLCTELKGLGYFKDTGKTGGPKERRNLPYAVLTRYLVGKNKEATATELWHMIPDDTEHELQIRSNKYYMEAGRVHALRKGSKGEWESVGKPIKFDAFRRRVGEMRKSSSRKPITR